ncbi:MAG: UDP-3-O-[3-hydroxymyristoyl] N-acetylglucosamine deacetylase [Candidatus Midichloriaceae bacterium]|jgi:UDP-3-O-[3-hydroxymyristoyl] N-acetylglucosamine deacetylase
MFQKTISKSGFISGIGLHTGENIEMKISPLECNSGIVFKRIDIASDNLIEAKYYNVSDSTLCTEIANSNGVSIKTVEHFMAALWGAEIDNILIEVKGPEIPAMDGSSKEFMKLLHKVGIKTQSYKKRYLKILDKIEVTDGDKKIVINNAEKFSLDFDIEFEHKSIGNQHFRYNGIHDFEKDISEARTFGFTSQLIELQKMGLAKGASLSNTIALNNDGIINPEGLRDKNEFVKHKILDCMGDLYMSGFKIIGEIKAHKSSHKLNNAILKKIFDNPKSYRLI